MKVFNCLTLCLYQQYSIPDTIMIIPHTIYISLVYINGGVNESHISKDTIIQPMINSIRLYSRLILMIAEYIAAVESFHRFTRLIAKYILIPQRIAARIIIQKDTNHNDENWVGDHRLEVARRTRPNTETTSSMKIRLNNRDFISTFFERLGISL